MEVGFSVEWGQGEGRESMVARGGPICRPKEEEQSVSEAWSQAMEGGQAGKRKGEWYREEASNQTGLQSWVPRVTEAMERL